MKNMTKKSNYWLCPKCENRILLYGPTCMYVVEKTLNTYIEKSTCVRLFEGQIYPKEMIRFLEIQGFIITTEDEGDCTRIIPNQNGCFRDKERYVFCWCEYNDE